MSVDSTDILSRLRADVVIPYKDGYEPLRTAPSKLMTDAADEIERLREALNSFARIADEAATQWDNDNDARVGKMLIAMAGRVPGYRSDIDAIHALRALTRG